MSSATTRQLPEIAIDRGVTLAEHGERVTVVYAFDTPGKRPSALRDRLAKLINY